MKQPTVVPGNGWHVVYGHTERPVIAFVIVDPISAVGFPLIADGDGFARADHLGIAFDLVHENELAGDHDVPDYDPSTGDQQ